MSWNEPSRRRLTVCALAALTALVASATITASASAVGAHGSAVIALANHAKGRTLSGQGVQLVAATPASLTGHQLTLPVSAAEFGSKPAANFSGSFSFKAKGRTVVVSKARVDVAAGALVGTVDGAELAIFRLGAAANVNAAAGTLSLQNGKLRLTADAANMLRDDLRLERALVHRGVGMIWVAAQANPTQVHHKLNGGSVQWGFLSSWREYIYKELGPGTVGSITTEGGATSIGYPPLSTSFFSFPGQSGNFAEGRYGASSEMTVRTGGSVKFAKPGHCITEIKLTNLTAHLGGATPSIVADLSYNIGVFNGKGCTPQPAVSSPNTTIATLNTSGISPAISGGNTVTWSNLPATLTEAAAKPFEPAYKAGQQLDPVTVTGTIG